ncbi:hypothetical protein Tco_1306141 [Tanacetum coccineum]
MSLWELQGDSQEDKLTTVMMLLARSITQKFSTPTSYGGNGNMNAGRQSMNQAFNAGNGNDDNNQIVQRVLRTESNPGKANVQSMKDEAESILNNKENDFMLDTSYNDVTMEELTAAVMLMARIQPANGNVETVPSYDAKDVSEVNASSKVHEQVSHEKRKTIIQTSDDDQIDSNIIFDDPYVENNGGTTDHDLNDHDKYHEIQILAYNLAKNVFQEREDQYLEDICDLEEKLSSHDRIIYKLGQSIQKIHMYGKTPNKVYDPFLKAGLGYKNLERLKKAIAAQLKMYDGEKLHSTKLIIVLPNSEETLKDAEECRLRMRNKMV